MISPRLEVVSPHNALILRVCLIEVISIHGMPETICNPMSAFLSGKRMADVTIKDLSLCYLLETGKTKRAQGLYSCSSSTYGSATVFSWTNEN